MLGVASQQPTYTYVHTGEYQTALGVASQQPTNVHVGEYQAVLGAVSQQPAYGRVGILMYAGAVSK